MGHAGLAAEELAYDSRDCAAAKDSKGMAAVGGDDHIIFGYRRLEPDCNSFLDKKEPGTRIVRHR